MIFWSRTRLAASCSNKRSFLVIILSSLRSLMLIFSFEAASVPITAAKVSANTHLFVRVRRNLEALGFCQKIIDPLSFDIFNTGISSQRPIYQGPDGSAAWVTAADLIRNGFVVEANAFPNGALMFTTVGASPNTAPQGRDIDIYVKCYLTAKVGELAGVVTACMSPNVCWPNDDDARITPVKPWKAGQPRHQQHKVCKTSNEQSKVEGTARPNKAKPCSSKICGKQQCMFPVLVIDLR
jgi:hypothetical protein